MRHRASRSPGCAGTSPGDRVRPLPWLLAALRTEAPGGSRCTMLVCNAACNTGAAASPVAQWPRRRRQPARAAAAVPPAAAVEAPPAADSAGGPDVARPEVSADTSSASSSSSAAAAAAAAAARALPHSAAAAAAPASTASSSSWARNLDLLQQAAQTTAARLWRQLEPPPPGFPPGPSGDAAVALAGGQPLAYFEQLRREHGTVVGLLLGGERVVLVAGARQGHGRDDPPARAPHPSACIDRYSRAERLASRCAHTRLVLPPPPPLPPAEPAAAREVLMDPQAQGVYVKAGTAFFPGSSLTGNGLLVSDGEVWRRQRRLANPAFRRAAVDKYAQVGGAGWRGWGGVKAGEAIAWAGRAPRHAPGLHAPAPRQAALGCPLASPPHGPPSQHAGHAGLHHRHAGLATVARRRCARRACRLQRPHAAHHAGGPLRRAAGGGRRGGRPRDHGCVQSGRLLALQRCRRGRALVRLVAGHSALLRPACTPHPPTPHPPPTNSKYNTHTPPPPPRLHSPPPPPPQARSKTRSASLRGAARPPLWSPSLCPRLTTLGSRRLSPGWTAQSMA